MSKLYINIVLFLLLIAGCSSGDSLGSQTDGVSDPGERFDLAGLDEDDTQSEITRLLHEGHVLYLRIQMFSFRGVSSNACALLIDLKEECNTWPDTVIREIWQTITPSGQLGPHYEQNKTQDGTVLATMINGDWTDSGSGDTWTDNPLLGTDLLRLIGNMSTMRERTTSDFPEAIEGNYLGRPSIIVPRSLETEHQIANPLFWRQTRWSEREDGTRFMSNESRTVDFAMLPPGSFPDFAQTSEN